MQPNPREMSADELVLSHFSLAREFPIEERVRLAGANGFSAIGLYVHQYRRLETEGRAPGALRELLTAHGVSLAEIEFIPGLGADGSGGDGAAEMEATAFRMADEFGCRYLQAIGPASMSTAEAGRAYGALCDRAADHGLVVGLEFLPFTDIVSVHDARAIVEAADRPNAGICVDIWHHTRGANDLAAIAALPAEMITGIQMSDGPKVATNPDYFNDCLANRVAPGAGEFDVSGFIAAVRTTGCTVPVAMEVCSASGWTAPEDHVRAIAEGMRAALSSP